MAAAALTGLAFAPSAPALAEAPAEAGAEHIVTHVERLGMHDVWRPVPRLPCPTGMQVSSTNYSDRASWNVPFGVEITQEKDNGFFGVDIWPVRDGSRVVAVGGGTSTISNWFGAAQSVTIRVHCVS